MWKQKRTMTHELSLLNNPPLPALVVNAFVDRVKSAGYWMWTANYMTYGEKKAPSNQNPTIVGFFYTYALFLCDHACEYFRVENSAHH